MLLLLMGCFASLRAQTASTTGYTASFFLEEQESGPAKVYLAGCETILLGVRVERSNIFTNAVGGQYEICLTLPSQHDPNDPFLAAIELENIADFDTETLLSNVGTYCAEITLPNIPASNQEEVNRLIMMSFVGNDDTGSAIIGIGADQLSVSIKNLASTGGPQVGQGNASVQAMTIRMGSDILDATGGVPINDIDFMATTDNGKFAVPTGSDDNNGGRILSLTGELIIPENYNYVFGGSLSTNQPGVKRPSQLILTPGSRIRIRKGATLTLRGSRITGCDDLWEAIIVEDGGTLLLEPRSDENNGFFLPTLRDAQNAVLVQPGGRLRAEQGRFINNEVGIQVEASASGVTNQEVNIVSNGSSFEQLNYEDSDRRISIKPSFSGNNAFAGAEINDVRSTVRFSNDGTILGRFSNMENGIVFRRSAAQVNGSVFEDMFAGNGAYSENGVVVDDQSATSINLTPSPINIGSVNPNEPTSFTNMETAVRLIRNTLTEVRHSVMDEVRWGVLGEMIGSTEIFRNHITSTRAGVQINDRIRVIEQTINQNTFVAQDEGPTEMAWGVLVNGVVGGPAAFTPLRITRNQFDLDGADHGVEGVNTYGMHVSLNNFNWISNMYGSDAISYQGGIWGRVNNNKVKGNLNQDFSETFGIDINGSRFCRVFCNTLDDIEVGTRFFANNPGAILAGNRFEENALGLVLGDDIIVNDLTFIGEQVHTANRWLGPFLSGFGARHEATNPDVVGQSLFTVSTANGNTDFLPMDNQSSGSWFFVVPNQPSDLFSCPLDPPPAPKPLAESYAMEVVDDTYPNIGSWTSNHWTPDRTVYAAYRRGELVTANYPNFNNWLNALNLGVVPDFYDVEEDFGNLYTFGPTGQANYDLLSAAIDTQTVLLSETYDELDQVSGVDSTVLVARADSLNSELKFSYDSVFFAQINAGVDARIQSLKNNVDVLSADSLFTANAKTVSEINIRYLIGGSSVISAAEIADLTVIADQCPYNGGKSVYAARALLGIVDEPIATDDLVNCQTPPALAPPTQEGVTGKATAFPNPTQGPITFRTNDINIKSLRVVDALGRVVITRDWSNGSSSQRTIDLRILPAGIYHCEITTRVGEVSVERITLQ
ncbi:hypothetical protein CEQ90_08660 [Lewinellaceae bacterium SD302]|nr:hypothetical protein CEQ90_08660 [Lewinellaceae bacterium SD302]